MPNNSQGLICQRQFALFLLVQRRASFFVSVVKICAQVKHHLLYIQVKYVGIWVDEQVENNTICDTKSEHIVDDDHTSTMLVTP